MSRAQAWCVYLSALVVGGTGLVYGWMRYLLEPADELSVVNHPLEPDFQHLHILFAPFLVFACGLVWSAHVWARVQSGYPRHRRTGLALFALFFPMVFSGVWVQVAETESARDLAAWTHAVSGTLWCLVFVVHALAQALRRGKTGPSAESTAASSRPA